MSVSVKFSLADPATGAVNTDAAPNEPAKSHNSHESIADANKAITVPISNKQSEKDALSLAITKATTHFIPIARSNSVTDVNEADAAMLAPSTASMIVGPSITNNISSLSDASVSIVRCQSGTTSLSILNNNPSSIESIVASSPAGSIEQFEATTTPISPDDASDSLIETIKCVAGGKLFTFSFFFV
jgi:hypothetical protein